MNKTTLLGGLLALLIACGVSFGAGYYVARDGAESTPTPTPAVAKGDTLDQPKLDDGPLETPGKTEKTNTDPEVNETVAPKFDPTLEPKPMGPGESSTATPTDTQPGETDVESGSTPSGEDEPIPAALKDQLKDLEGKLKEAKLGKLEDFEDMFNGPKVDFSATVSGQVVDGNGIPVAGATVHGSFSENYMSEGGGGRISYVMSSGERSGPPIATTDSAGYFTADINRQVSEKASLQVSLTASADKFAESKNESFSLKNGDTKDGVKLTLRGAGSVTGRVVDASGRGVSGVTVKLASGSGTTFFGDGMEIETSGGGGGKHSATTDGNGEFVIEGVPEGRYKFNLSGAGYRQIAGPTEIDVKTGMSQRAAADFQVAITSSVTARFTDVEGQPVKGWATLTITDDNGKTIKRLSGALDGDGGFAKNDPPAGSFNVEVRVWGYKAQTIRANFTEGQKYDLGTITLEKDDDKDGDSIVLPFDE